MPVHVSLLTPRGRGAVATIGVRGQGAIAVVARCFAPASGRKLQSVAAGDVVFGQFSLGEGACEDAVVGVLSTNEIEVHCHGGVAVAEAVCGTLSQAGAVRTAWEDWFDQLPSDPIKAEAFAALPMARTERTAGILLDQYRGALRTELVAIDGLLECGNFQSAAGRLSALLARQDIGLHLTQPWRVVLTGRPNAGKSSLLNALAGYQRAIVFAEPGTTRDILTATTAIDGWPIELADTAGLRDAEGEIEFAGVSRAVEAILAADLAMLVVDTTSSWDKVLHEQIASSAERVLIVHNKCDLQPPGVSCPPGIVVSAKTGVGVASLLAAIVGAVVCEPLPPQTPLPFSREQIAGLQVCLLHTTEGRAAAARGLLMRWISPNA